MRANQDSKTCLIGLPVVMGGGVRHDDGQDGSVGRSQTGVGQRWNRRLEKGLSGEAAVLGVVEGVLQIVHGGTDLYQASVLSSRLLAGKTGEVGEVAQGQVDLGGD